jgi:hypothetical protein
VIKTFEVRRRAQIGDGWREAGEPCPEAHLWRLTWGLVTGGVLIEKEMSEKDFAAAVQKYCPEDAGEIYPLLGIEAFESDATDDTGEGFPKTAPRKRASKAVLTSPPKPLGE